MNIGKFCPLPLCNLIGNLRIYLHIVSLVVILSNCVCDNWVYRFPLRICTLCSCMFEAIWRLSPPCQLQHMHAFLCVCVCNRASRSLECGRGPPPVQKPKVVASRAMDAPLAKTKPQRLKIALKGFLTVWPKMFTLQWLFLSGINFGITLSLPQIFFGGNHLSLHSIILTATLKSHLFLFSHYITLKIPEAN